MNTEPCCKKTCAAVYVVAAAGALLLTAALVALTEKYTAAPPLAEIRGQERLKNIADLRAANNPILNNYDWQDQGKGIVRVPVERAKELILQEWQDPTAGRSNLMARATKAFAPAPKPAEVKSPFE